MNEKGLSQLAPAVKVFIVSYAVLVAAGLLLTLWLVWESPTLRSGGQSDKQIKMLEDAGLKDEVVAAKNARFYSYLKLAHVHHLGHVFMVFTISGLYAFTRGKDKVKIQVIIWTAIATLFHTLAFLIYSRLLLVVFGSLFGSLLSYMLVIIVFDCYKPVKVQD